MGWQQQIQNSISEPAEIHGLPNGQLPTSVLSTITDKWNNNIGQLCHTAARAWQAMVAAAAKDNVGISARDPGVPPSSTYRSLPEQEQLWNDNYDHTNHGHGGRSCGGDYRYLKPGMNVAACPGTSNHGRGLAVDSNVEVDGVLGWFEAHAKAFGWQWEINTESWHIHYFPGDAIPQAVLDYEKGAKDLDDTQAYELKSVFEAVGRLEVDNAKNQQTLAAIAAAVAKLAQQPKG